MKTLNTFLALVVICFITTPSAIAQDNSLLYKIEGNGIKTSHIFGTFHMLSKEDFELKDKVKRTFDASNLIVMELDMTDPKAQREMMGLSMIPGDDVLQNHMTEEEYKILDNYFTSKMGIGMAQLNKMKPLAISSMVLMAHLGKNMASYEYAFIDMAKESSKQIKGLETAGFQIGLFDDQPYQDQIEAIVTMLTTEGGMGAGFDELIKVYKTEDIEALYATSGEFFGYDKDLQSKLLDDRNQNWIPQIGEFSKDNEVFYAVGAAHLGGEQGVINLLKEAGYCVTPVLD